MYACVRLLAESIAALPLHLYRVTDDNGNKEKARDHPLYKILYRQPNPEMTSFVFWETRMTHLLLWGNAYAQIVRDGKNTVLGFNGLIGFSPIAMCLTSRIWSVTSWWHLPSSLQWLNLVPKR